MVPVVNILGTIAAVWCTTSIPGRLSSKGNNNSPLIKPVLVRRIIIKRRRPNSGSKMLAEMALPANITRTKSATSSTKNLAR